MKQAILDKLAEVEAMLQTATCDGVVFADDLEDVDGWTGELDLAMRTLAEHIDYYLD